MLKKHLLALGLTGLAASTALAGEFNDDRFYVAPFGSYLHTGGDRQGLDGWGGGLAIGKIINEYFNVELKGFWQNYSNDIRGVGGRTDLTGGTADVQYFFFRDTFSPYVVAGLGGMNTSLRVPGGSLKGSSFIFETGVGATYEIADNFLLRGDVRYRLDTFPSSADIPNKDVWHDMVVNVGFMIPFGDKPGAETKVEPTPAPTAKLECANRDSDADGVNDCDDKCPGTLKGTKVDEVGCPIRIELKGVNFKYNSAELTPSATAILDGVSNTLIDYPQKRDIEVRGHTSSEGTSAYNLKLSQKRSASVVDYLKRKGVTNRLIAKGYGEDYPVADNSTEDGRSKNRRVELIWTGE